MTTKTAKGEIHHADVTVSEGTVVVYQTGGNEPKKKLTFIYDNVKGEGEPHTRYDRTWLERSSELPSNGLWRGIYYENNSWQELHVLGDFWYLVDVKQRHRMQHDFSGDASQVASDAITLEQTMIIQGYNASNELTLIKNENVER